MRRVFLPQVFYVGGPNQRKDYHLEEGEELFYMKKGDMVLKILEAGIFKDVPIKEGEVLVATSYISSVRFLLMELYYIHVSRFNTTMIKDYNPRTSFLFHFCGSWFGVAKIVEKLNRFCRHMCCN